MDIHIELECNTSNKPNMSKDDVVPPCLYLIALLPFQSSFPSTNSLSSCNQIGKQIKLHRNEHFVS